MLTIGKVANEAAVNIQTVRYYERIGLVKPNGRRGSGYRVYADEAVRKIRFIRHAQDLGFTLQEISALLRLRVGKPTRCDEVRTRAERRLEDIRKKIANLRRMEQVLVELVTSCWNRTTTESCPILRSLERNGKPKGGSP
jgi:Hg(II)-responsive transcriptional regulator